MALQLLPLTVEDLTFIQIHASIYEPGDDLVDPPIPVCWPVTTREGAPTRLRIHMARQSERTRQDPSVNYLKVIDESGSIISIARWHWYPNGYSYEREGHWKQYAEATSCEPWAHNFNIPLNNFILGSRDAARENWIGKGQPCWTLMHLVTRPSQRGKGAARLLIQWGIDQATKRGVPAFLEAGVLGMPIYQTMGFRQVEALIELDFRSFGVEMTFVMAKMVHTAGCRVQGFDLR